MSAPTRILIADDHALVRDGTRGILEREDDLAVVGEAADGAAAVEAAERLQPNVVILDIGMPEMNGIEATRRIKATNPSTAVLVLTVHDEEPYVVAILEAGAAGYLLKDVHGSEVVRAVRAVRDGESVLHPAITGKVLRHFRAVGDETADQQEELTDRELEVLRHAARGASNKEIAAALELSPRTVQVHISNVFRKLDAASRTEAVIHGLQRGLFDLEELA